MQQAVHGGHQAALACWLPVVFACLRLCARACARGPATNAFALFSQWQGLADMQKSPEVISPNMTGGGHAVVGECMVQ